MKYMGSKRLMLENGLGEVLRSELSTATRFVDLFSGSGAVSAHVARRYDVPVKACDLQYFSVILAKAVLDRTAPLLPGQMWNRWLARATEVIAVERSSRGFPVTQRNVRNCRQWCEEQASLPFTQAFGGHYFSPRQTLWIDALRATLPIKEPARTTALAALIDSVSQCAAAPGHTAQPFQPTRSSLPHIEEAWNKDIVEHTSENLRRISGIFARRRGTAEVADANDMACDLRARDLVFIDPPYSGVQYSRFYHVLESVAQGTVGGVIGVGRYSDSILRPRSKYSLRSESAVAFSDLAAVIAGRGANAIVTFPDRDCSNGLSGSQVREIFEKYFVASTVIVKSRFSTLGGARATPSSLTRGARQMTNELILVLKPKRHNGPPSRR